MSLEIVKDEIGKKLDELADLSEYWKKNRDKGYHPSGVRAGMMCLIQEITFISNAKSSARYAEDFMATATHD